MILLLEAKRKDNIQRRRFLSVTVNDLRSFHRLVSVLRLDSCSRLGNCPRTEGQKRVEMRIFINKPIIGFRPTMKFTALPISRAMDVHIKAIKLPPMCKVTKSSCIKRAWQFGVPPGTWTTCEFTFPDVNSNLEVRTRGRGMARRGKVEDEKARETEQEAE
ncbi:hypothetical protein J6590_001219 [Homalodisca vitripennis]|nr:hypothetical protein J6590_001219 [Homalodisca vitripennis]